MAVDNLKLEPAPTANGESIRILDEMERLMGEMQNTMAVIKRLIDEEGHPTMSAPTGNVSRLEKEIISS